MKQIMVAPGWWAIEGYTVKRIDDSDGPRGARRTVWIATRNGSWFTTRRTLREVRDDIRQHG